VTELGLAVATGWPDGVWFVDLSPLDDASLIPAAIANAIGAAVPPDADAWATVLDHLRERSTLLILDTAEHLVEGLVDRVGAVLEVCPDVAVLATSRVPTSAKGEQLWRLEPLETAAMDGFEDGLVVDGRVGHEQNIAIAHANLAETALILGRRTTSAEHALACLRRSGELGMTATVGMAMANAASGRRDR